MKENNFAKEMREECERKKTAARRILEISAELRLTWAEIGRASCRERVYVLV